jgi:hypothetical protein
MKQYSLLVILLLCLAAALSAQATNLIISEYVEGSSYQKALEIFNGTGGDVDLSTVSLKKQTNGAGAFGSELVLSGILANNDVYVIVNSSTGGTNLVGQPFVDLATTSQAVNFNGNDAVALFRGGVMLDVVGIVDQVEIWGADMTLVRNSNIASPTTVFNIAEWTSYPINTFSYLGAHTFTGGTTDPTIIVSVPNTAVTWYFGYTYTIGWSSANITGNVSIGLMNGDDILYYIEGSNTNSGSYSWTIPNTITAGNQFRIKIATMDGTVSDVSDAFFSIMELPVTNLASIADLRNSTADGTTIYRVTNDVVLTYQQTYRFKKYFQDTSGAIEIDDFNGVITTPLQIGDAVANLTGTLSTYHNLLQLTPFANVPAPTSSGNDVNSPVVTINELTTNFDAHESELIYINNVTFLDTSTPFATGIAYNISDPTGQMVFRTNFYEADYIGQAIPTGAFQMRVITTQYDDGLQVTARSLADFSPVANEDDTNTAEVPLLISIYPNPFTGNTNIMFTSKTAEPVAIGIYNLRGQLVRALTSLQTKAGQNSLNWDGKDGQGKPAAPGIYFYNMKGGRYTSTKKMVLLK